MKIGNLRNRVTLGLRSYKSWDFSLALYIAAVITILCIMRVAYVTGYLDGEISTSPYRDGLSEIEYLYTVNGFRIFVILGLVIGTIGLWSRKATGFF
ncbi:MAG: hypothetical protein ACRD63_14215, partial [Pyrinomonadaceae bacterium]